MSIELERGFLFGKLTPPPSKSQSLRALLFKALAKGESTISNLLESPDIEAMKRGIEVIQKGGGLIDCGNSGITLRFLAGIAALNSFPVTFTGDASLMKRPMKPLLGALKSLGAKIDDPLTIRGPIKGGKAELEGVDSQYVSSLLIACSLAEGDSEL
ncbi:MAG: 3-phosphoshikimate 1-carboxyvinyltransferase, partial [Parachlamydiaceae bacterium]